MVEPKTVTAAIVISLVAGVLIVLGSVWVIGGSVYAFGWVGIVAGAVAGLLVLFSAMMLKIRPGEGTRGLRVCCRWWGALILVFSIVGFIGGSVGGLVGSILGIVGAAFALTVKV